MRALDFLKDKHEEAIFPGRGFYKAAFALVCAAKYFDQYPLSSIKLPKTIENDLNDVPDAGVKIAKPKGDHKFITEHKQWEKAVQGYLASITFADGQIRPVAGCARKK